MWFTEVINKIQRITWEDFKNYYSPAKQYLINKTRERNNGIQKKMEEAKLSLFTDIMDIILKDHRNSTKNKKGMAPVNTFLKKDTLQEMKPAHVSTHR